MSSSQNFLRQSKPLQSHHLLTKAIQVRHPELIQLPLQLQRQSPNQRLRFPRRPAWHEYLLCKAMHPQQILAAELKYLSARQVDPYSHRESRQLQ